MVKTAIMTSSATSLSVVARDIVYVLSGLGHECEVLFERLNWYDAKDKYQRSMVVMTYDPLYVKPWWLTAYDHNKHGVSSLMYVTVEGMPKKWLITEQMKHAPMYVANSRFTQTMLREVGVDTNKVVYHGVNYSDIKEAVERAGALKQELKEKMGVNVLFGTVATSHPRKGLRKLAHAISLVSNKLADAGFLIITTHEGCALFSGIDNVKAEATFGKRERKEILTLLGSFDFLIHPALSEGFGLPVLEAQALGVPVIYPEYQPLTEVAHPDANFGFRAGEVMYDAFGDGILYACHDYMPQDMAEQIEKAYEVFTCNRDEYDKRSNTVKVHAKMFDAIKIYSEFDKVWG
jgi:glycosyltransferase involved in cell wall biosynthesis